MEEKKNKIDELVDKIENCEEDITLDKVGIFSDKNCYIYPTGIHTVDNSIVGGIATGEVACLVAPSGKGKTTWIMSQALNASNNGAEVLFIAVGEQEKEDIGNRFITNLCGIDNKRFYKKCYINGVVSEEYSYSKEDIKKCLTKQQEDANFKKIHLAITRNPDNLIELIRLRTSKNKVKYVCIDYIQTFTPDKEQDLWKFLERITEGLKMLANECNCAIITAMQTNATALSVLRTKPDSFDPLQFNGECIAASKAVETKVDYLFGLFYYGQDKWVGDARYEKKIFSVIKNRRNGKIGWTRIWFDSKNFLFKDCGGQGDRLNQGTVGSNMN